MKKLFVAMPYGIRKAPLDFENLDSVVEINFDAVWSGILQPAIPENIVTKRADELRQPGLIDRLFTEWLFDADIVLADLTFNNPNVYYELGIRQALSRRGTVLVACKGTRLPFDVRNQFVIYYDYFAAPSLRSFQQQLREGIENADIQEVDSPIHLYLPELFVTRDASVANHVNTIDNLRAHINELEAMIAGHRSRESELRLMRKIEDADSPARVISLDSSISMLPEPSIGLLESLAIRMRKFGLVDQSIEILHRALTLSPTDPEILRELGFAYRKKGSNFYDQAEKYMNEALRLNDRDPELHGMLGGLQKRRSAFHESLVHYQRAYDLDPSSLYALVNLGAVFAALKDLTQAKKWYANVRAMCSRFIEEGREDYWTYFCLGEALVATGDEERAISVYSKAIKCKAPVEDIRSATEQLQFFIRIGFAADAAKHALAFINSDQ